MHWLRPLTYVLVNVGLARRSWFVLTLGRRRYRRPSQRFDQLYLLPDPWRLDSEQEHGRFQATSRYLSEAFGHVGRMLELGCGEGLQSGYLAGNCDELTGLDVSARAIARAQARLPEVDFVVGDLQSLPWSTDRSRFDVVVACEVLYYLADPREALATMTRLARRGCLVTYYADAAPLLDPLIAEIPNVRTATIGDKTSWRVAWWPTARPRPDAARAGRQHLVG